METNLLELYQLKFDEAARRAFLLAAANQAKVGEAKELLGSLRGATAAQTDRNDVRARVRSLLAEARAIKQSCIVATEEAEEAQRMIQELHSHPEPVTKGACVPLALATSSATAHSYVRACGTCSDRRASMYCLAAAAGRRSAPRAFAAPTSVQRLASRRRAAQLHLCAGDCWPRLEINPLSMSSGTFSQYT